MFDYTENSMIINNSLLINHGGGGDIIMQLYSTIAKKCFTLTGDFLFWLKKIPK
jgi:hypothetical protein